MKTICRILAVLLLSGAAFAQTAPSDSQSKDATSSTASPAKLATPAFPEVDGEVANNVYTNHFFGMSMALPEHWRQLDWKVLINSVKDHLRSPSDQKYVDAAANMTDPKRGLMLLTTTPTDGSDPLLMVTAMELGAEMKAVRAEDFLVMATMPLIQGQFTMTMKPEPYNISGREFSRVELLGPDHKTTETMIFTILKNHALGFVVAGTEQGRIRGYEIVNTVKFSDEASNKPAAGVTTKQ